MARKTPNPDHLMLCGKASLEKKGRKRKRDERFVPRITFLIREPWWLLLSAWQDLDSPGRWTFGSAAAGCLNYTELGRLVSCWNPWLYNGEGKLSSSMHSHSLFPPLSVVITGKPSNAASSISRVTVVPLLSILSQKGNWRWDSMMRKTLQWQSRRSGRHVEYCGHEGVHGRVKLLIITSRNVWSVYKMGWLKCVIGWDL